MLVPMLLPGLDHKAQRQLGDRHGEIFKTRYLNRAEAFPGAHHYWRVPMRQGGK